MIAFKAKLWLTDGKVYDACIWTDSFDPDVSEPIGKWAYDQTSETLRCADKCKLLIAGVMQADQCVSHVILGGEE